MEYDVTIDRDKYIGGSDLAVIMGLSPYKDRFTLLLEKAGLKENPFEGNKYTDYGNEMEPKIRSYLSECYFTSFSPSKRQNGDLRAHTDGFDGVTVIEIKTTTHIHKSVGDYKHYLVQLLFYMKEHGVFNGILAVYDRPADFSTEFDSERLQIFNVSADEWKTLTDEVYAEIDRFRADLARLKANPLLTEQDFQPTEIITLAQQAVELEIRLAKAKEIEKQYKAMKQKLYEAMKAANIKSWTMPNETRITLVEGSESKTETVKEFDIETFKAEQPKLYDHYTKEVEKTTAGKSGYIRISMPKE